MVRAAHVACLRSTVTQPQQNETPPVPTNSPKSEAVPLPNIPDRVEALDRLLREIENQLMPESELLKSKSKTREHAKEPEQRASRTRELLLGNTPTTLELEDEQRYWRARSLE